MASTGDVFRHGRDPSGDYSTRQERPVERCSRTYAGADHPREELFDTLQDPHQVRNLAASADHQEILARMRQAHRQWIIDTRDTGFLPEGDLWSRLAGRTPWDIAQNTDSYPLEAVVAAADLVGLTDAVSKQRELLRHADPGVRFWAAVGLRAAGPAAREATADLEQALVDKSPSVRLEAAAVLAHLGEAERALPVLIKELHNAQLDDALHAARTLQWMGQAARPAQVDMQAVLAAQPTGCRGTSVPVPAIQPEDGAGSNPVGPARLTRPTACMPYAEVLNRCCLPSRGAKGDTRQLLIRRALAVNLLHPRASSWGSRASGGAAWLAVSLIHPWASPRGLPTGHCDSNPLPTSKLVGVARAWRGGVASCQSHSPMEACLPPATELPSYELRAIPATAILTRSQEIV